MSSILEQIAKQRAERIAQGLEPAAKPSSVQIMEKEMRGSGLSKKMLGKQQAQIDREERASMKSGEARVAAKIATEHLREATEETLSIIQKDYEKGIGITFDDSQEQALYGMLTNKRVVLIGPAGSGKTTITREYIKRLLKKTKVADIACAAFTGRAVQQMKRALPSELQGNCSTIHMLLGFVPTEYEEDELNEKTGNWETKVKWGFKPTFDASNKLKQTHYIFDETGMLGTQLWNQFIDACPEDATIVLIGDIHQLPPVMDRSVLGFAMNKWPTFELKKIHRQSEGNAIIDNAHRVLHGEAPINAKNFHLIGMPPAKFLAASGAQGMQVQAVQWLMNLWKLKKFDPIRDAFIVPQNIGLLGQLELNPHLMTLFNPPREENGIIVNKRIDIHTGTDRSALAIGDKMMVLSNINNISPPITNGMVGVVKTINLNGKYDQARSQFNAESEETIEFGDVDNDNFSEVMEDIFAAEDDKKKEKESRDQRQASHVATIEFENGQSLACSTAGDYRRIGHAYAITCHKSQGGEYPNVVILLHSANHRMLSQEWLYTAITRARENVYIFGNAKGLAMALKNQKIRGNTLQEKIKSFNDYAEQSAGNSNAPLPVLWEPEKVELDELEAAE